MTRNIISTVHQEVVTMKERVFFEEFLFRIVI